VRWSGCHRQLSATVARTTAVLARSTRALAACESGQDIVEYALLLAFFGLACLSTWDVVRSAVGANFSSASTGAQDVWEPLPPGTSTP
jgi:Flp pilus assembly pilin Flp